MNFIWNLVFKEFYVFVKSRRFIVIVVFYFIIFGLVVYFIKDYFV